MLNKQLLPVSCVSQIEHEERVVSQNKYFILHAVFRVIERSVRDYTHTNRYIARILYGTDSRISGKLEFHHRRFKVIETSEQKRLGVKRIN